MDVFFKLKKYQYKWIPNVFDKILISFEANIIREAI
jgi:hypothetical protein